MRYLNTLERASKAELAKRDFDITTRVLARIVYESGEGSALDETDRQTLSRVLRALDRLQKAQPSAPLATLVPIRTMILGKLGRFDEAIAIAQQAHKADPSWSTAISVANAHRRAGNLMAAIKMWRVAAKMDPDDVTAWLEIGDSYLVLENWSSAIQAYEQALMRDPRNAWAKPSMDYCQYRATGERKRLGRVQRRAKKKPDECGVGGLLAQLSGSYTGDVGIDRARQLLEIDAASRARGFLIQKRSR